MSFIYQNTDLPGETKSYRDAVEEVLCSPAMADGATGWFLCSGLEGAVGAQPGSWGKQIHYVSPRDEEASSKSRVTPSTTAPAPLSCCPQSQQVPAGAWPVAVAGRSGGSGSDTAGRSGEAAVAAAAAVAAWQRGGREHRPRHPAPGPQVGTAREPSPPRQARGELPGRGGAGGKGGSSPGAPPGDGVEVAVLPERDPGGPSRRAAGVAGERGGQCGPGASPRPLG